MSITCEKCGATIDDSKLLFDAEITCPTCFYNFSPFAHGEGEPSSRQAPPPIPKLKSFAFQDLDLPTSQANVSPDDLDQLLSAESNAPAVNMPHRSKLRVGARDEKTEAVLRSYGAGQETIPRRLTKEAVEKIDRGLRLHFVATIAFTMFLFLSSLGVGAFLGGLTVATYAQLASDVSIQTVAGLLVAISVICFALAFFPLGASIVVDFLSLLQCLSFPEEKGAKPLQIVAAVFRGLAVFAFVGSVVLSLIVGAPLAASLSIGVVIALLPLLMAAWGCYCASLGQVGAYLDRKELVDESRRLLAMGFTTMIIIIAAPILSFTLVASGYGLLLVAIVLAPLILFFGLLHQDPTTYLINFGLYVSSLKFSIDYANYLQCLREVICRQDKL